MVRNLKKPREFVPHAAVGGSIGCAGGRRAVHRDDVKIGGAHIYVKSGDRSTVRRVGEEVCSSRDPGRFDDDLTANGIGSGCLVQDVFMRFSKCEMNRATRTKGIPGKGAKDVHVIFLPDACVH